MNHSIEKFVKFNQYTNKIVCNIKIIITICKRK